MLSILTFAQHGNVRIGCRANQILVLSPAVYQISFVYPEGKCAAFLTEKANVQHTNVSTQLCILTDFRNLWEFSLTLESKRSEELLLQKKKKNTNGSFDIYKVAFLDQQCTLGTK